MENEKKHKIIDYTKSTLENLNLFFEISKIEKETQILAKNLYLKRILAGRNYGKLKN